MSEYEPGQRVRTIRVWVGERPGEVIRVSERTGLVMVRLDRPVDEHFPDWWFKPDELEPEAS